MEKTELMWSLQKLEEREGRTPVEGKEKNREL